MQVLTSQCCLTQQHVTVSIKPLHVATSGAYCMSCEPPASHTPQATDTVIPNEQEGQYPERNTACGHDSHMEAHLEPQRALLSPLHCAGIPSRIQVRYGCAHLLVNKQATALCHQFLHETHTVNHHNYRMDTASSAYIAVSANSVMWWLSSLLTNLALLLMSTGKHSIWYTHLHKCHIDSVRTYICTYVCIYVHTYL